MRCRACEPPAGSVDDDRHLEKVSAWCQKAEDFGAPGPTAPGHTHTRSVSTLKDEENYRKSEVVPSTEPSHGWAPAEGRNDEPELSIDDPRGGRVRGRHQSLAALKSWPAPVLIDRQPEQSKSKSETDPSHGPAATTAISLSTMRRLRSSFGAPGTLSLI